MPPNFLAIKQRIQSSHIPPCRRHMVIATNLSSLFDLLHCSTPQTRAECCLEFAVGSGYGMFPGLSGSATPPPIVPVRRAMQGSPPISQHQKVKQRLHGRPTGARTISWARGGGGGCRKGLQVRLHLRPGLCTSPLFACGVPAACHAGAWGAGHWMLCRSLSMFVPHGCLKACGLRWPTKALPGQPPFGKGRVREGAFVGSLPEEPLPKGGRGLESPPPPLPPSFVFSPAPRPHIPLPRAPHPPQRNAELMHVGTVCRQYKNAERSLARQWPTRP